jgi:hypothetical protein
MDGARGVGVIVGVGGVVGPARGSHAALAIVSVVGWTAGFLLPRGAAGVVWIACAGRAARDADEVVPAWSQAIERSLAVAVHAVTVTICPFVLIGVHPPLAPGAVPIALGMAVLLRVVRAAADTPARRLPGGPAHENATGDRRRGEDLPRTPRAGPRVAAGQVG